MGSLKQEVNEARAILGDLLTHDMLRLLLYTTLDYLPRHCWALPQQSLIEKVPHPLQNCPQASLTECPLPR